jgi:predicted metal-binding protein
MQEAVNPKMDLETFAQKAISMGASDAMVISSNEISVADQLARYCRECPTYGLSPSCPPYVSGPDGFRELKQTHKHVIVVRLDTPATTLLSDKSVAIFRLLHEIVAGVEQEALCSGYSNSKAFAGGSCKKIFCADYPNCSVLAEGGICRYPQTARPSMSGFGIDVSALMRACGWPADIRVRRTESDSEATSWIAGLVMLG